MIRVIITSKFKFDYLNEFSIWNLQVVQNNIISMLEDQQMSITLFSKNNDYYLFSFESKKMDVFA